MTSPRTDTSLVSIKKRNPFFFDNRLGSLGVRKFAVRKSSADVTDDDAVSFVVARDVVKEPVDGRGPGVGERLVEVLAELLLGFLFRQVERESLAQVLEMLLRIER